MSRLRIFSALDADTALLETQNPKAITEKLAAIGVHFERWQATQDLAPGASSEAVLAAYRADIDRIMQKGGYQAVDVISLNADHPDRVALRQKFLNEHTHAEDEVRFFVGGGGLFTIHAQDKVFEIECKKNDLINLPAGTQHWFDMGEFPSFIAIRIFTNPAGWVANFTGSDLAQRFARYETTA
jgi:1,2-dihydroxy-3-keto-5-methylthiopentene dioxygenase